MLLEFFLSIIFEGLVDASGSSRISLPVRLLLFTILCSMPIALFILCIFTAYKATGVLGAVISGVLAIVFTFLWIFGCCKIIKSKQNK